MQHTIVRWTASECRLTVAVRKMSAFLFLPLTSEIFKFPSWASHTEDMPIRCSSHCSVYKDFRSLFSLLGDRTPALPTFYLNTRRDSGGWRAGMKEGGLMRSGRPCCILPPLLCFSIFPTRFPVFLIVQYATRSFTAFLSLSVCSSLHHRRRLSSVSVPSVLRSSPSSPRR